MIHFSFAGTAVIGTGVRSSPFNTLLQSLQRYCAFLCDWPGYPSISSTHGIYSHRPCELQDLPTEGPPVRYWQFERTP
ncbi:unnamed protein product, partial [Gongylonema pulchrum]|uniref:Secreted protein n=1 Tax=Gongylonema pulchrum TaxID=637853 RepID=A0A183EMS6_9BILA